MFLCECILGNARQGEYKIQWWSSGSKQHVCEVPQVAKFEWFPWLTRWKRTSYIRFLRNKRILKMEQNHARDTEKNVCIVACCSASVWLTSVKIWNIASMCHSELACKVSWRSAIHNGKYRLLNIDWPFGSHFVESAKWHLRKYKQMSQVLVYQLFDFFPVILRGVSCSSPMDKMSWN